MYRASTTPIADRLAKLAGIDIRTDLFPVESETFIVMWDTHESGPLAWDDACGVASMISAQSGTATVFSPAKRAVVAHYARGAYVTFNG